MNKLRGGMREIELPISPIVNLCLAVQLWLRRLEASLWGVYSAKSRIEDCW